MIFLAMSKYERLVKDVKGLAEGERRAVVIEGVPVVIERSAEEEYNRVALQNVRCPD